MAQGTILRTILLVVALAVVVDFGLRCLCALGSIVAEGVDTPALATQISADLCLYCDPGFCAWSFYVGFKPSTHRSIDRVEAEATKVTWPKHREIMRSTIIIAILTAVMGVAIWLIDTLWVQVVYHWLRIGGAAMKWYVIEAINVVKIEHVMASRYTWLVACGSL